MILLAVILQSAIVSRIYLLSGIADLPLVMLAAWALQEEVESAWHWAVATGLLVGFVSGISWFVPVVGYFAVVALAQIFAETCLAGSPACHVQHYFSWNDYS